MGTTSIWIRGDFYQLHGYSKSERKRKSFAIYSSSNHGSSGNDNGSSNNAGSYYSSSGDDCGTSPVLRLRSGQGDSVFVLNYPKTYATDRKRSTAYVRFIIYMLSVCICMRTLKALHI